METCPFVKHRGTGSAGPQVLPPGRGAGGYTK